MPEWARVKLGEVLTLRKEFITIDDTQTYKRCRAQWRAQGVILRDIVPGTSIKTKKQQVCRAGEFLVAEIDAKEGGFGIVPDTLDGSVVSSHYFLFQVDETLLDGEYLGFFTRTDGFMSQIKAQGSTNYSAVRPANIGGYEIPLPPLPEQRRIVARVKGLLEKVEEARRLRAEVVTQLNAYSRSVQSASEIQITPIGDLVRLRPPNVMVTPDEAYHFAGVYSFGRGVFVGQKKQGQDFAYPRLTRLQTGNFTYPKLMAWEGAFGLVPTECDGLVVSTEYPVFEIDSQKILPEVLESYFKNPTVWTGIAGESTGTNARRRRLNPADFLSYPFPLPSMADQLRIAHASKAARQIQRGQAHSQAELDALPSAILARAFAGAL